MPGRVRTRRKLRDDRARARSSRPAPGRSCRGCWRSPRPTSSVRSGERGGANSGGSDSAPTCLCSPPPAPPGQGLASWRASCCGWERRPSRTRRTRVGHCRALSRPRAPPQPNRLWRVWPSTCLPAGPSEDLRGASVCSDGAFAVRGGASSGCSQRFDVDNEEAMAHLEERLRQHGRIMRELEAQGFQPGDEIEIAGVTLRARTSA